MDKGEVAKGMLEHGECKRMGEGRRKGDARKK